MLTVVSINRWSVPIQPTPTTSFLLHQLFLPLLYQKTIHRFPFLPLHQSE